MRHPILVVEDRRSTRDGLVEILDRAGFVGIPAANGREALDYLEAGGRASVILLDAIMPEMDGWTFRRAQQRDPRFADIPVVLMSALQGRAVEGMATAAALEKPVDAALLTEVVSRLCDSQPGPDPEPRG